jgi:putative ABC transport system permease protein
MNYIGLIIKNPFRNKTRTALAIVGIAVGIMVIVALGLLTSGLQSSTQSTLTAGSAEITVSQAGSSNEFGLSSGSINPSRVTDIKTISGVKDDAGILSTTINMDGSTSSDQAFGSGGRLIITGIESNKLNLEGITSVNGTVFNDNTNEIIVGKSFAENQNKSVGDSITLFNQTFKITGIYETGNIMTDMGAFMSLTKLQNLTIQNQTSNNTELSNILVKVTDNANVTEVSQAIEDAYPNELSTITAAEQAERMNSVLGVINDASWAISLLAIFIGGVGVINTMIMSVFERTREIGVLKAVGWKSRRILGMILGESIVLTLIAGVIGTIVGIIAVEVGIMALGAGTILEPVYSIDIFLRAFGIAILVGIIGGIYPAYRASKLAPTEALRYE